MKRILILLLLAVSYPAQAEPPLPPKKEAAFAGLKAKVEAEKARQKELDRKAVELERDLTIIKNDLVKTAGQVQKNEKDLQKLEIQLAALKQKKNELTEKLGEDRASLSGLLIALERIRRLPPETLIAKPGAPRETAQAATALQAILPELNRRAEALKAQLQELGSVEEDLVASQEKLKSTSEKLKTERSKMDTLLANRSKTYEETRDDLKVQQKAVEQASKEAENFEDLIRKIEEKNRRIAEEAPSRSPASSPRPREKGLDERKLAATLPSLGSGQLPVSGIVRVRFGDTDEIGSTSKGIRIEGRSGAVVVAPLGGIVRYAGQFKSYGNIVLLEHKNNYHSLIAGLGRIDTVVGQSVDSGEPVGSLGAQSGERPTLYYELRLNGQPINPARKFTDLGT